MFKTKDWYKSKTVWLGIIAVIYNILALIGVDIGIDQPNATEMVNTLFGVLAVLFRWSTTDVITQSKAGAEVATTHGLMTGGNDRNRRS